MILLSSQTVQATYGTGLTTNDILQQPIGGLYAPDSWLYYQSLRRDSVYAVYIPAIPLFLKMVHHNNLYPDKDSEDISGDQASQQLWSPIQHPIVRHHADALLLLLLIAARLWRLRGDDVCSPFFPRSVGFFPTDSCASGAFDIQPSTLSHFQSIHFTSSYFSRPAAHIFLNAPCSHQNWKYRCIALAAPKRSFGRAFHCMPVLMTKKIASKALRLSIGGRPAPGFLLYCLFGSLFLSGRRSFTTSQNSSVIFQDCFCIIFSPSSFVLCINVGIIN